MFTFTKTQGHKDTRSQRHKVTKTQIHNYKHAHIQTNRSYEQTHTHIMRMHGTSARMSANMHTRIQYASEHAHRLYALTHMHIPAYAHAHAHAHAFEHRCIRLPIRARAPARILPYAAHMRMNTRAQPPGQMRAHTHEHAGYPCACMRACGYALVRDRICVIA